MCPLDLVTLASRTAHVSVPYAGELIDITYAPEKYTNATHNRLLALGKVPEFDPLVDVLAELLTDWDVVDGGKSLPVTAESLGRFPIGLLTAIAEAVISDVSDQRPNGSASVNGSSATEA